MRIRCVVAHMHLILTTTRSAWFRGKTLLETLSSSLKVRQMPWFPSRSSRKRITHLFCRPSCSCRILRRCVCCKCPTLPFGGSSTGKYTKLFLGSALRHDWSSAQRNLWAVESQLRKNWKLATGTSSKMNWVAYIQPMLLPSVVGILRL